MGAGSAKGLRKSSSLDDGDKVSINSDGQWEDGGTSASPGNSNDGTKRSKSFDFPPSNPDNFGLHIHDSPPGKKEQPRRKLFTFSREKGSPDDKNEDDSDSDSNEKKENNTRRFNIFGGRKKDKKDEKLDEDIDDIEKTFDSLGIAGKNSWNDGQDIKPKQHSKDDLDALEPMRNKTNVRISRPTRGINGLSNEFYNKKDVDLNSTSSSRRKFNFSWENDDEKPIPKQTDDWNYKAVSLNYFLVYNYFCVNMYLLYT